VKRGRGRPRREGGDRHSDSEMPSRLTGVLTGKPAQRRQGTGNRIRKLKPLGYPRKKIKQLDRIDLDLSCITPSPVDEMPLVDPETGTLIFTEREKPAPILEELPYFPEQWPGKVCAFCNLGERSQLGQGQMLRLICPEGFIPQRVVSDPAENMSNSMPTPEREAGDKSPRGPVTCRRQKSFNKCRHPSLTSEYVDELTIIGYTEEPHVSTLFDSSGYFYAHRSCAAWSHGVTKNGTNIKPTFFISFLIILLFVQKILLWKTWVLLFYRVLPRSVHFVIIMEQVYCVKWRGVQKFIIFLAQLLLVPSNY
jgi:hypothetical protein